MKKELIYGIYILQKTRYLYFLFYKRGVYIIFTFCKCFKNWETNKFAGV